jgi:SAM-dependent methyltransferase
MMSNKDYWNKRFQNEGYVWGTSPSQTAKYAVEIFRKNGVHKVLVPGSGYGRNTKLFSESGFDVTGIEISDAASQMAREYDPQTKTYNSSVIDMSFFNHQYDAVYCYNVLHLFREKERFLCLKECADKVKEGGLLFFTVFSEKEPSFGKGQEVEKNTFESRPGRPVHYFTEAELRHYFECFEIVESGIVKDPEDHGEGPHTHVLLYILARKSSP